MATSSNAHSAPTWSVRQNRSFPPTAAGWRSNHPERALRREIDCVLAVGYLRGADCWHLATALYPAADPGELTFLSLDERQRDVAVKLGFAT